MAQNANTNQRATILFLKIKNNHLTRAMEIKTKLKQNNMTFLNKLPSEKNCT